MDDVNAFFLWYNMWIVEEMPTKGIDNVPYNQSESEDQIERDKVHDASDGCTGECR